MMAMSEIHIVAKAMPKLSSMQEHTAFFYSVSFFVGRLWRMSIGLRQAT